MVKVIRFISVKILPRTKSLRLSEGSDGNVSDLFPISFVVAFLLPVSSKNAKRLRTQYSLKGLLNI